jgi:ArsR family transcriptional regulator
MQESEINAMQTLFLCLSDATRLRIIEMLCSGERSVSEFVEHLNEPQPKISRHLATMRDDGVVMTRRDGKHIFYALNFNLGSQLTSIFGSILDQLSGGSTDRAFTPYDNTYAKADMMSTKAEAGDTFEAGELPVYLL